MLVGLIAGASAAGQWRTWLLCVNARAVRRQGPAVPAWTCRSTPSTCPGTASCSSFGFATVVLSPGRRRAGALPVRRAAAAPARGPGRPRRRTGHLSVLLGLFVSLKAVAYWLDRYGLAVKSSGFKATDDWTGLRYVDANAYLPAKTILFCIAIICALLFFATLWRRTWQPAGDRLRADGAVRDPDRRALPGDRAEVPGAAERGGQGGAVHPEEHRRDAGRVRHRRRQGRPTTRAPARRPTGTLRTAAASTAEHPAARPQRGLADLPAAPAGAGLLLVRLDRWTSTATRSTARSRTPWSVCAS